MLCNYDLHHCWWDSAKLAQASALSSNTTDNNNVQSVANSLIDAFSTNTVTAAAKALKDLITINSSSVSESSGPSSGDSTSSSNNNAATIGPLVQSLEGLSAPLGSGDNLAQLQSRIAQLKGYYKDARTFLHTDDAVRIGGYIATLESLGIQFLAAFPIAELSFFIAELALATAITGLLGGILYTAASAVGLAGSIIFCTVSYS
ncbi:hypothetical protein CEUSTIGMA_g4285.t1 [Chlamydomonas eustigma]|uniref:Uncharacterized protein n=1 Tax=Chlamydomonas eustigma TaxID=1157962 RepID=A0A250X1M7_9CHLO|nr:hypothetical protein CEUSTIGMA_g4285.t1 [Chlamydomonas eustigma]|eukprot:GAX76839.1 hypothetical protein CEUSTIGMA_g4285.t1 [Chlamydomonas eustigma]